MTKSEISEIVDVKTIPAKGVHLVIKPDEAHLKAIAKRLKINALPSFVAKVEVKGKGRFIVKGSFEAVVTYTCVVSLDAFDEKVFGAFESVFSNIKDELELIDSPDIDMDMDDIEPVENDKIDVGELVIQQLALALNPFPRKDKKMSASYKDADFDAGACENPFDQLKALKN